jgi:hypothetical protein
MTLSLVIELLNDVLDFVSIDQSWFERVFFDLLGGF